MTRRAVWILSLFIVALSLLSVAYQALSPDHFDSATWKSADEPSEFLNRRAMMEDLNRMFNSGEIATRDTAQRILGDPERTADDDPRIWYYNLGGQQSAVGPEAQSWLELTFNDAGSLIKHRLTQDTVVPLRAGEGGNP